MEHHEAVYEQIIEVSNANQGADFLSHHLVQEIVVPNEAEEDNNQESNCEIAGMDILLPSDCITVQDSNLMISCSADGIDKQTEHLILQQESTKIEHISHVNNVGNSTNYTENYKEVKAQQQQYVIQDQTTFSQETYQVENSVLVTSPNRDESVANAMAPTSVSNSTSTNHTSLDSYDMISSSQSDNTINTAEIVQCTKSQDVEQYNKCEQVDGTVVIENKLADANVPNEESQVDSQIHSTNEDDNGKNVETVNDDNSTMMKTEPHLENSVELAQNNETGTETHILVNSDDIAVMAEFNTIEYSTEEEIGALQEAEPKRELVTEEEQPEEQSNAQEELVKNELDVNYVEIEANGDEIAENKPEASSKEDTYNQSSREEEEEEEDEIDLHLSTQSTDSHRKVIQDIFDDWQDENCEEENNQSSDAFKDHQDSVEKELQNLLNDDAQQVQTVSSTNVSESQGSHKSVDKSRSGKPDKSSLLNKSPTAESSPVKSSKSNSTRDKSSRGVREQEDAKKVHPRPGVKVPGSHLTSPIASTAEVAEALNKRLREKQKDLVVPKAADIVFVKKISQRLSNQLSQVVASMPPSVPLQPPLAATAAANEMEKTKSIEGGATSKASSVSDNNDLLAILEGDADPEWSNLKSEKTSNSNSNSSSSGKLDPVTERELALKQLLELPNITSKKNAANSATAATPKKPKKTKEKETTARAPKEQTRSKIAKEESKPTQDGDSSSFDSTLEVSPKRAKKSQPDKEGQNSSSSTDIQVGVDESRSGRKRKLTEKAREHELAVKRQKVFKSKAAEGKKQDDAPSYAKQKADAKLAERVRTDSESTSPGKPVKTEANQVKADSPEPAKQTTKGKVVPIKKSKLGLLKKNASISKKKLAVKNLLRQKAASKNSVTAAKSAKTPPLKKADGAATSTPEKTIVPAAAHHKGKKVSEIDRLLQDEGVVNLLYDVEQPDSRKRLVPITKSQKKVMDVEKAERELKLRTKLVKNAVLRLRNSASATVKISPRSRRSAAVSDQSAAPPPQPETRKSNDATRKAAQQQSPESTDFVIPAKIRNAAEASRIIRRHSSSSFSSASASPRVSIDVPPESIKPDELEAKRKLSSHDSTDATAADAKKSKKKAASKSEPEDDSRSPSKKATRSSAAAAATATTAAAAATTTTTATATTTTTTTTATTTPPKATPKSKKLPKSSRSSSEAAWNDVRGGEPPQPASRDQDELSACLAEAASALQSTSINGSSRSSSSSARKKAGNTRVQQSDDDKLDSKKFSNKEINVRRHGHLIQLILTPSAPVSGIRNAITIPVMNEIREALAILGDDDDCRVVLFTSTGTSFCEGLELGYLQQANKEERKMRAEEMANAVRDFVRALAAFNKPIVAGVQGAATGLGVTMLPLFDLVIASDKATFSTPYGKLGQIAEGAAVLTLSHSLGSAVTNELLLGGRTLTASEALRAGLVTRVLWPDRFQGELLPSLKVMSEQSAQAMEATKALLRHGLRKKLDAALESESLLLVQHWCSQECQEAIKAYIEEKGQ